MTNIKPEQVPEAAAHALIQSDIMLMSAKEQIAAALNAWPGKSFEEKHNLLMQTSRTNLIIPIGEP